jgi:hypothetical protein
MIKLHQELAPRLGYVPFLIARPQDLMHTLETALLMGWRDVRQGRVAKPAVCTTAVTSFLLHVSKRRRGKLTVHAIVVGRTKAAVDAMGGGGNANATSTFQLNFTKGCAIVQVGKHPNNLTIVDSRGYNTSCSGSFARKLERAEKLTYTN